MLLRGRPGDVDLLRRVTACFLCILLWTPVLARADDAELFFFSPDWGPGNLNTLAEAADRALSASGLDLRFQAFARYEDLATQLSSARPALVLVPHWVAAAHGKDLQLEPLLRPTRSGRDTYHKVLMTKGRAASLADLVDSTIAAAAHPAGPPDIPGLDSSRARIIPVPKDIDALLALSFGQVDAALVTRAQFEILSQVNPRGTSDLWEVARTRDVPLPRLYGTRHVDPSRARKLAVGIASLGSTPEGRHLINLLGFDEVELLENTTGDDRAMAESTNRREVER